MLHSEGKRKPYLRNIIIDLQNSDTWKIQLTIAIDFISSKQAKEERAMHSRSGNIKSTPYNDADEVVDEFFEVSQKMVTFTEEIRNGKPFFLYSVTHFLPDIMEI